MSSTVPLMSLKSNARGSDMVSEDDEDPLESLLTGMNFRAQKRRSRTFWSSLIFAGMICFTIGFAISYIAFVMVDKNSHPLLPISTDVDPAIVSTLLNLVTANSIGEHIRTLDLSHNSITSENLQQAKYIQQYFTEQGFDSVSSIKPSTVLLSYFNYNQSNKVDIIDGNGDTVFRGSPIQRGSTLHVPGTSVYSRISGRSSVYVNFGRESDFLYLKAHRVSIKDAIVLARVGKVNPMNLIESALKHGAKGVILFPDPQQYPDEESMHKVLTTLLLPAQLGMLQSMHGNASVPGAYEVDNGIGCVPIQLIPAVDAEFILRHMASLNKSPLSWRGNFSSTLYNYGPGFASRDWQLSMVVHMVNVEKQFYNVIAAIKGSHEPDRYVVLANNRAPLVDGGLAPTGGTAAMMELARVFSWLRTEKGWQPRRSIVFCSWGDDMRRSQFSDEWGYSLESRTVAYLSFDVAVGSNASLNVQASPLLSKVLFESSALVPNPNHSEVVEGRRTLYDSWAHMTNLDHGDIPAVDVVRGTRDLRTSMYNNGIPSLDFHYGDANTETNSSGSAVNNSYVEARRTNHRAVTQLWGILTWKMTDSLVVPLDVTQYATFLNHSVSTIGLKYEKEIKDYALPLGKLVEAVKNFMNSTMTIENKLKMIDGSNNLELRIMNDLLFQLDRSFLHHSITHKTSSQLSHIVLSPGTYLDNDRMSGFGTLQDLLSDLMSCIEYESSNSVSVCVAELVHDITAHLSMLNHCVTSATYILQDPLQPLALADF